MGDHPGMIWLGATRHERHLTFGDFSRLSNRFANAVRSLGVGRGDRVMVPLGEVPEWQAILTGLLKLSAIAISYGAPNPALDNRFEASDKRVRTPRPT